MHHGWRVLVAIGLAAFVWPSSSLAQAPAWPHRPVKILLPLGPGSGADIGARLIAEKLSIRWGQPVVVENRPGGDGFVAITAFVGAKDDHTFLFAPAASFTSHPYLHEKLPYDARDLVPVARVSTTLLSIAVPPQLKINTLGELVALARSQPGKLNWATVTGATDLVVASFFKSAGLDMAKIPYRDPVQAVNDATEGRLHFYWSSFAIVRAHAQAGRVKIVATPNSSRIAILPDVPTVAEAGFPQLTFDGLVGFYGMRDLPSDVRERVASDVRAVLADQTIVDRFTATGQVVNPGSGQEFAAAIDQQSAQAAEAGRILGVKPAAQ